MIQTEIEKFEKDFNITLPEDYKNFLIYSRGEGLSFEYYPIEIAHNDEVLEFGIIDFESLVSVRIGTESLWKLGSENISRNQFFISNVNSFIHLTTDVYSRIILLGVKNEYYGKIYGLEKDPTYPSMEVEIFLLETSFAEFFNKILLNN